MNFCVKLSSFFFFLRLKKIPGDARIFFSGLLNRQEYFHSIFLAPEFFWYFVLGIRSPEINPGTTCKFIPPPWYKGGGGWRGLMEPLPRVLDMLLYFKPILPWKAYDLLNKMRYTLWVLALLEACDITNNGRHLGRYLGTSEG